MLFLQPLQMLPQDEIDIAGDGAVVVFGQLPDFFVDRIIERDAYFRFQRFHIITQA